MQDKLAALGFHVEERSWLNPRDGICSVHVRDRDCPLMFTNSMSAGNTAPEAHTQALSEIFERYAKFRIISEGLCLPDVPQDVINRYPRIAAAIQGLRDADFGILVKDARLGGQFPVMNVTLLNPHDHGCFASFGAHPRFEIPAA